MNTGKDYDVIVVGSGAGGGTIAGVTSEGGKRVLLLEKGRDAPRPDDIGRDHLRNQRLSRHGVNAGPDDLPGNPRVFEGAGGVARAVLAGDGTYSNNAAIGGGGTRVYGGQAWRFHPLDFRMASTYGVPAGSSLADWPIGYDELAPFYSRAEHELGVCGDAATLGAGYLPGLDAPYPMPRSHPTRRRDGRSGRARRHSAGRHFPCH